VSVEVSVAVEVVEVLVCLAVILCVRKVISRN
jgi:hypothetical protein